MGEEQAVDWAYVLSLLGNEPWGFSPEEIGQLTPTQVFAIYLCPRDKDGRPLPTKAGGRPLTPEELEKMYWRYRGLEEVPENG